MSLSHCTKLWCSGFFSSRDFDGRFPSVWFTVFDSGDGANPNSHGPAGWNDILLCEINSTRKRKTSIFGTTSITSKNIIILCGLKVTRGMAGAIKILELFMPDRGQLIM